MNGSNAAPGKPVGQSPVDQGSTPVKPKVGKNAVSVGLVFVLVIVFLAALLLFAFVKTGFYEVPVLSRFYHGPRVSREVPAAKVTGDELRERAGERLVESIAAGESPFRLYLTESEVTGAISDSASTAVRGGEWEVENSQVAIHPSGVEFTARLLRDGMRLDFQGLFVPYIRDGGVRFRTASIRIGDYPIHPALGTRLAGSVFSRDFGTWVIQLDEIDFTDIELREGSITVFAREVR